MIINHSTSHRFDINRGVRQGCPISPFLFILVVELLSLNIVHDTDFKGISTLNREIRTTLFLFLKDKEHLVKAIDLVQQFLLASGLKLNVSKCELLPIHNCDDTFI